MGRKRRDGKAERAVRPARRRARGRAGPALFRAARDRRHPRFRRGPRLSRPPCAAVTRRASSPTRPAMRWRRGSRRCEARRRTAHRPCSGSACSTAPSRSTPTLCSPIRPAPGPARRGRWIARADYEAALAAVKAHIDAGDVYQANLTFQAEVATAGHPLALYAALRRRARAGHGGLVFTGSHWLFEPARPSCSSPSSTGASPPGR